MNTIKIVTSSLVLILTFNIITGLPATDDKALNDLYESLLQREYTGVIPLQDHQVERKAVRSPSLRLRFGRSDPDLSPSAEKRFFSEVNKKPIRSPSLRLRFGRRSDPMMPLKSDNYDYDQFEERSLYEDKRAPSVRLRWGRSSFPVPNELVDDSEWINDMEKRVPRLRWGRSGFPKEIYEDGLNIDDQKRAPAVRLRWGRSANGNAIAQYENLEENLKKLNTKDSGNNEISETSTQYDLGVN